MSHISCIWTPMVSLYHLLTGLSCWQLTAWSQVFRQLMILPTLAKILFKHQIAQFIYKLNITLFILWLLFAISSYVFSTGLCLETSNKIFTVSMKNMGGEEVFIWKWFTHFQEPHALLTLYAQIASSKEKIGNLSHTWQSFTALSVGVISWSLEFNNIHSSISIPEKPSKISSGLI